MRVVLALICLGWLGLGLGLAAEARRSGPELLVREYLADLEAHRLDEAMAALTPRAAERWADFVEFQQYNRYEVVSVAVRSPSLLESVTEGQPWRATQLTLVADVTEPSGLRWRGSTVVPLAYEDGRWLLREPPFAPGG